MILTFFKSRLFINVYASKLISMGVKGIKGIDRIVPIGSTMEFDLVWDGYDLTRELTRVVTMRI